MCLYLQRTERERDGRSKDCPNERFPVLGEKETVPEEEIKDRNTVRMERQKNRSSTSANDLNKKKNQEPIVIDLVDSQEEEEEDAPDVSDRYQTPSDTETPSDDILDFRDFETPKIDLKENKRRYATRSAKRTEYNATLSFSSRRGRKRNDRRRRLKKGACVRTPYGDGFVRNVREVRKYIINTLRILTSSSTVTMIERGAQP